jgi:outer membrane protein
LRQANSRYEVGLSAITDVQEAQARFDSSRAQELAAASSLRSSREALRVITGQYPDKPQTLRTPLSVEAPQPANPDAWVEQALQNNVALQTVLMNTRVAREQVRETESAHYPRWNLFAEHTINDLSDTPQQLDSKASTVGLQLEIPLFSGGGSWARSKQSQFKYQKAESELLRARRETSQQARDAYDGVVTGEVQVAAFAQASKSSGIALEALEAGFKVGSRTSVDVLNAQRELFRTQRDLSRARYDYLLSLLRLERAVGALSADDLQRIDRLLQAS